MERYKAQKPTYCMECKYFQHTGKTGDGKRYELGGECHNEEYTPRKERYRNGGCDVCVFYEKADDGREVKTMDAMEMLADRHGIDFGRIKLNLQSYAEYARGKRQH